MKLMGTHVSIGSKVSGNMWVFFFFFCEDHCWFFVIINQCKKQSLCFEKLYVCVCIYICSQSWNVLFCNLLEVKVQYTPSCYMEVVVLQFVWNNIFPNQIIWKFIYYYYRLCPSRFFSIQIVWTLLLWNDCYGMRK